MNRHVIDWSPELKLALICDSSQEVGKRFLYDICEEQPEIVKIYEHAGTNCPYLKQAHYVANHTLSSWPVASPAIIPEARDNAVWVIWGGRVSKTWAWMKKPMVPREG